MSKTVRVGRLEVTRVLDATGADGGIVLSGPADVLEAFLGAHDGEVFLGAAGELVTWTAATTADHRAAIADFEALLRMPGACPDTEGDRVRIEIAAHRYALKTKGARDDGNRK